jgi:hypothetical protein
MQTLRSYAKSLGKRFCIGIVAACFAVTFAQAQDCGAEDGARFAAVAVNICKPMLANPGNISSRLKEWRALPINPAPLQRHDPGVLHAMMIVDSGLDFIVSLKKGPTCGVYLRESDEPNRLAASFAQFYRDNVSDGLCVSTDKFHPDKADEIKCVTGPQSDGLAIFGVISTAANPNERGFAALATFGLTNHAETVAQFQTKGD